MKIALICLTKDFNRPGNSGSYRDYLYIKRELEEAGHSVVTINSKTLYEDHPDYDGIVMLNASVNFFGGVINENLIDKWKFIARQKCPIVYWFTDFLLPLQNIIPVVKRRFDIDLPEIKSNRITVLSYAQETNMVYEWWNKNKKNIPISKVIFYDLSESCFKGLTHMAPKELNSKEVVYIGNFRNGHRLKQLEELSDMYNVTIHGRWPKNKIPFGVEYKGPCLETKVDEILNNSWMQYVTYDYEYLKFKPTIFRNIITINSGSLPLIDNKLDYVLKEVPKTKDYVATMNITNKDRMELISDLQHWLHTKFENRFAQLIKEICLSY